MCCTERPLWHTTTTALLRMNDLEEEVQCSLCLCQKMVLDIHNNNISLHYLMGFFFLNKALSSSVIVYFVISTLLLSYIYIFWHLLNVTKISNCKVVPNTYIQIFTYSLVNYHNFYYFNIYVANMNLCEDESMHSFNYVNSNLLSCLKEWVLCQHPAFDIYIKIGTPYTHSGKKSPKENRAYWI